MSGVNVYSGTDEAATLAHRMQHLTRVVIDKVSRYRTQSPSVEEILLGTTAKRLDDIPIPDFDQTQTELTKFVKKHGCCSVRVAGDNYTLTELAIQAQSAAELLAPYRPLLGGAR